MTQRNAFSLIELMVAVLIIAALIAMLLPGISAIRRAAYQSRCLSSLRQLAAAGLTYANDNNGLMLRTQLGGTLWPDLIAPYIDDDSQGNGYLINNRRQLFRNGGCPARKGSICDTHWLQFFPAWQVESYSSYGYFRWWRGRIGPGSSDDLQQYDGHLSAVTHLSRRAWFFDACRQDENLHCPAAKWTNISGKPGINHNRHGRVNGYAFMDGHAQMLAYDSGLNSGGEKAWMGLALDKATY